MNVMKFFQGISRFLAAYTSPVIVGVAAITFVYPELFRWVKGDIQTLVLGIIMLTMGMTLTTDDFKILAKRPLDIFIGAVAQYTLMPLIAFVLVKVMNLPPGIAAGLLSGRSFQQHHYLFEPGRCGFFGRYDHGIDLAGTGLDPAFDALFSGR